MRTLTLIHEGNQPVYVALGVGNGAYDIRADRLVISQSYTLTISGLTPGQKFELYRSSDNALLGTATCAGGATTVTFNIDVEDYPLQLYGKVYATDGATLIETTPNYEMVGGDTWEWNPDVGTLTIVTDQIIIYRTVATGTPKTANITATLLTPGGAPYPGVTVYFSTTRGTMTPASDTTDANGNAHSALTSTTHGIAVVEGKWLGDANVPACSGYVTVHVFYEAESGDTSKGFQFYVEGIEYVYVSGRYALNEEGLTETFEVEVPQWVDTITKEGLVSIYRKGIKEFGGILKVVERSLASTRVVLRGSDVSILLNTRVVDLQIYPSKTPQYIIADLLTKFPCGLVAGSLGANPNTMTITIDTESLFKAIPRIVDDAGWVYRINMDRTLDFADNFTGGTTTAVFTEGDNIFDADRVEDTYSLKNRIRMKGDVITSTKQDGNKIKEYGLLEGVAYQKTISSQATLDLACQAELDLAKEAAETINLPVLDNYPIGTFGCEDQITVESPTVGLSGYYTVKSIERDMTDANYALLELSNRSIEYWELDEAYRRMTKDASV